VTFELNSHLRQIQAGVFCCCPSLKSICIPASVEIICESCFSRCDLLSSITFERQSVLAQIGREAFANCPLLQSISLPDSFAANRKSLSSLPVSFPHCFISISNASLKTLRMEFEA
jgi:hypothetical protein